jgi:hypothetical protein
MVPDEADARLVLLYRRNDPSERRVNQPPQQQRDAHEDHEHEIEEGHVALEVDGANAQRCRQPLDLKQAILAAGQPMRLDRDEPEHLAEGDGHERVVDATAVRDEERNEGAGGCGRSYRHPEAKPQAGGDIELRKSKRVGADAEEGSVPERRQAGVAEQEVVGQCVGGKDKDLDTEVLVEPNAIDP